MTRTRTIWSYYKGFQASRKRGQTLDNYQEARTRRVHMTLDKYLAA